MHPHALKDGCNRNREQGYILLTLLLVIALLIIGAVAIAPSIAFDIKRDREEELVHRGVQYTRAIRRYMKTTGRYPVKPEDLLGGPDARYIRKLYKDPITGKDFRLLHLGDLQAPGTNIGTPVASLNGAAAAPQTPNAVPPVDRAQASVDPASQNDQQQPVPNATNPATNPSAAPLASGSQPGLLIFGVASTSRAHTIREFNHKNRYNDWYFFYDSRYDQGYEIKGPTSLTPPSLPIQPQPGETGTQTNPAQQPQQTPPQQQQ